MTIAGRLPDGPLISLRLQAAMAQVEQGATSSAALEPSDRSNFPPREVQVERSGWKSGFGVSGLVIGGAGVIGAGAALVRSLGGGMTTRPNLPTMLAFGAAVLVGGAFAGGSRLIPPRSEHALAAGIPTKDLARQVDAHIHGRTQIVETTDGTFAIIRDTSPVYSGGGSGGSSGGSRSNGGGSRPSGGSGGGYNPPSYPSTGGSGSTSRGDDSGSSRNSTSNGNPSSDDF